MTPVEIKNALAEIRAEGSKNAYVSISIAVSGTRDGNTVIASFYPEDLTGRHHVDGRGEGFAEAIEDLRRNWDAAKALADKNTIRKMALAIIEITGDQGECSDAALRGAGFYQPQIDRIGFLACAEATRLAAGGPFSIVSTVGANAEVA